MVESRARAASTSTPHSAYWSFALAKARSMFPPEEVMAPSSEKAGMTRMLSSAQFCPNTEPHTRDSPESEARKPHAELLHA